MLQCVGKFTECPKFSVKNIRKILQTFGFKSLESRLGLGTFNSRSRLEFLLKVSVSQRQCLVSVSKILAETPALKKALVWATRFSNVIKLEQKEKHLASMASITYKKKTKTMGSILTNYKLIAHRDVQHDKKLSNTGSSAPCEKCTLCGHKGNHNSMVPFTHKIVSSSDRTFSLKQNLTCADYGVIVATCRLCSEQYVGQTVYKFLKRWTNHCSQWKGNTQQKNDNAAFSLHFANFYHDQINPQLSERYKITYSMYLNPITLVI